MPIWNFISEHVLGAFHLIWLVWPWLLGMAFMECVRPGKRLHWPTWLFNALYIPAYLTVTGMTLYPIARYIAPNVPLNILGLNMQQLGVPGAVATVVIYLVLFDFFYYWFHRLQHASPFMWRYHRYHHSDPNTTVTTATRHHWLEEVMRYFLMTIPLVVLVGHPEVVFPWLGIAIGVDGLFIHWNTRLRLGFLNGVVVGPQYHRLHHSIQPVHINKNFSVMFPLWDRIFGTQCLPQGHEFPDTGVSEVRSPNGWRHLLPWPSRHV